jgi:glycosyltransferase involved in cell wall biosynthesis
MHLVLLNLGYRSGLAGPQALLEQFRALPGWCEAVLAAARDTGLAEPRVTVVQRFHRDAVVEANGVGYRFVDDGRGPDLRWWRGSPRGVELTVEACRESIALGRPSAVHVNGLGSAGVVPALRRRLPAEVPVILQHHAERPRVGLSGLHQRWALARADGFMFAARALARPWIERRVIRRSAPIFEVMEGSTSFSTADRGTARRRTGIDGGPVFLWVGRLDANKDPLTILNGFATILKELPRARLYMAHGTDSPLLSRVEATIAGHGGLRRAVRILGTVPHHDLEAVYNSADYFLLGSHSEGSGFALAEAMACSVVPIVTDIPSFRMMTGGGAVGALWRPGRADELVSAVRSTVSLPVADQSVATRELFARNLSYRAIGGRALEAYRSAILARVSRS